MYPLLPVLLVLALVAGTNAFVTLMYMPGWAYQPYAGQANYFDSKTVNLTGVTHVAYSFVGFGTNGVPFDAYDNMKANAFATKLTNFMVAAGADGLDIDWEFPTKTQTALYTNFLQVLRTALDSVTAKRGYRALLTAALTGDVGAYTLSVNGVNVTAIWPSLDLINMMTYDLHDPCYWETQTAFASGWVNMVQAIDWYQSQGVPASRLVLGLAAYGHQYTLMNAAQYTYPSPTVESRDCSTMVTMDYHDIIKAKDASAGTAGIFISAQERSAYYVSGKKWIGFDIEETIWAKVQGAQQRGLAGAMMWEITLDKFPQQPLLRAITSPTAPPTRPCGNGYIGNGVCANTAQCCSQWGWCGTAAQQCGAGCRSGPCTDSSPKPTPVSPSPKPPSPKPPSASPPPRKPPSPSPKPPSPSPSSTPKPPSPKPPSPKPPSPKPPVLKPPPSPPVSQPLKPPPPSPAASAFSCGNGNVGDGRCADPTQCCSQFGYCGATPDHCGAACLTGPCIDPGTCGGDKVGNGRCYDSQTQCCSSTGYCGTASAMCGTGCLTGPCYSYGTCGGGSTGNSRCALWTDCCSQYGWCGTTTDHCGANCVGGPCKP